MIPTRHPVGGAGGRAGGDDGGVRYRRARPATRADVEAERRALEAALVVRAAPVTAVVSRTTSDFTFADVFSVPPMASVAPASVAARSSVKASSTTVTPLLDGFLAC